MKPEDQVDGQLDVFDVLDLIGKEGDEDSEAEDRMVAIMQDAANEYGEDDGIIVVRGERGSYVVQNADGENLHPDTLFWTQIECWAFIVGYRSRNNARP